MFKRNAIRAHSSYPKGSYTKRDFKATHLSSCSVSSKTRDAYKGYPLCTYSQGWVKSRELFFPKWLTTTNACGQGEYISASQQNLALHPEGGKTIDWNCRVLKAERTPPELNFVFHFPLPDSCLLWHLQRTSSDVTGQMNIVSDVTQFSN